MRLAAISKIQRRSPMLWDSNSRLLAIVASLAMVEGVYLPPIWAEGSADFLEQRPQIQPDAEQCRNADIRKILNSEHCPVLPVLRVAMHI